MANDENDDITAKEAGRRGGKATSQSHGREFYQDIGKKGGQTGAGARRVQELVEEGKEAEEQSDL